MVKFNHICLVEAVQQNCFCKHCAIVKSINGALISRPDIYTLHYMICKDTKQYIVVETSKCQWQKTYQTNDTMM